MISKIGAPGEVKPGEDNYYKLYDVLVGPNNGPRAEKAKAYVINEGLLEIVEEVQYTPIRFTEYGDTDTMVIGADESGGKKPFG
jgi:hypothetical protein